MASTPSDKYRPILQEEPEKVQWRHGGPPRYDDVNRLFEEGRTKVLELCTLLLFILVLLILGCITKNISLCFLIALVLDMKSII